MPDTVHMTVRETPPQETAIRPQLAVSACLLGQPVRYDGGHKRQEFLVEVLPDYVDFLPLCPEAGSGMGTPRPPIQLVRTTSGIRARGVENTDQDFTDRLHQYADMQISALTGVSGYLFKSRSPSCGSDSSDVYDESGQLLQEPANGLFCERIRKKLPNLPIADEHCFDTSGELHRFLCQVFIYYRWQSMTTDMSMLSLTQFHREIRPSLSRHQNSVIDELDRLVRNKQVPADAYIRKVLASITSITCPPNQAIPHCFYPEELRKAVLRSLG